MKQEKHRKTKTIRPIVWTIDPYETKSAHRGKLARFLKVLGEGLSQKILPFSVVSPAGLSWPVPEEYTKNRNLQKLGKKAVEGELQKLKLPQLSPPTVEVHRSNSRKELVKDVLNFSRRRKAGFIAVNTRRLLSPFPFKVGGFAEALIGNSPLPIIAVSPKAKVSRRIRTILFPTDLSPSSHFAFRKTLELAAKLHARVHLIHLETLPPTPYSFLETPAASSDYWYVEEEKRQLVKNQRLADRWIREAKELGVRCSFQEIVAPISLAKAILRSAQKQRADLICLTSHRKPTTPALVGGTVRDVLSHATTPVLEFHAA